MTWSIFGCAFAVFSCHHAVLFWLACHGVPRRRARLLLRPSPGELARSRWREGEETKKEGRREGGKEGRKEGEVLLTSNYRPSPERRGEKIWNKGRARGGYIATQSPCQFTTWSRAGVLERSNFCAQASGYKMHKNNEIWLCNKMPCHWIHAWKCIQHHPISCTWKNPQKRIFKKRSGNPF